MRARRAAGSSSSDSEAEAAAAAQVFLLSCTINYVERVEYACRLTGMQKFHASDLRRSVSKIFDKIRRNILEPY
jgi:hypothetical protein